MKFLGTMDEWMREQEKRTTAVERRRRHSPDQAIIDDGKFLPRVKAWNLPASSGVGVPGLSLSEQAVSNPWPGQVVFIEFTANAAMTNVAANAIPGLIASIRRDSATGTVLARYEDLRVHVLTTPQETHQAVTRFLVPAADSVATFYAMVAVANRAATGTIGTSGSALTDFATFSIVRAQAL